MTGRGNKIYWNTGVTKFERWLTEVTAFERQGSQELDGWQHLKDRGHNILKTVWQHFKDRGRNIEVTTSVNRGYNSNSGHNIEKQVRYIWKTGITPFKRQGSQHLKVRDHNICKSGITTFERQGSRHFKDRDNNISKTGVTTLQRQG